MVTRDEPRQIVDLVLKKIKEYQSNFVQVGVSNRHVHLSQEDLEVLFGPGHDLTVKKELVQPGQYAAEETVTIKGPKGSLKNVRILGPVRNTTQVEISKTDSFGLGVKPPVVLSGNLKGTPGLTLVGPRGSLELKEGVIIAKRHIHMTPQEAADRNLSNGQQVFVETFGERKCILGDVVVRVARNAAWEMHLDVDEANACSLKNNDIVLILTDKQG